MDEKKRDARIDISKILFQLIVALICFIPMSAFALGVGQVKVLSALNQPLNAEIPLLAATAEDLAGLNVKVSSQTFEGVGGADAEFNHAIESRGNNHFIRITSRQAIREPLLNFLLEVEWPKGRLLREFAILLNPPGFVTRSEPEIAPPAIPPTPEKAPSKRTRPPSSSRVAQVAQPSEPAARQQPDPEPVTGTDTSSTTFSGTYGPVRRGETLWVIAERVRPDSSVSVSRMMQALLQNNRQAFVTNNANTLMAGATLRIPVIDGLASTYQNNPVSLESSTSDVSRISAESEQNETAAVSSSDNNTQVVNLSSSESVVPSDGEVLESDFQISLNEDRLDLGLVDLDVLRDRIKDRIQEANDEDRPLTEFLPEESSDEDTLLVTDETVQATEDDSETASDELTSMSSSETTSPEMATPEMNESMAGSEETSDTTTGVALSEQPAETPDASTENTSESQMAQDSAQNDSAQDSASTQDSAQNNTNTATTSAISSTEMTAEPSQESSTTTTIEDAGSSTAANEEVNTEDDNNSGQQEIAVIENGSDTSATTTETTADTGDLQQDIALDTAETGSSDWMGKFIQFTNDPLGALGDFSSTFDDPIMLPAIGGGVVLLLLLLWLLLRRSKKSETGEDDEDLAFEPIVQIPSDNDQDRMSFDDQQDDLSSDEATQPSQPRPFRPATNPIERVDLLLAVGNYREAENVARLALADDANNADLLAKMLDIHYAAGNAEKFQEDAETLRKNIEDEDSDPRWRSALEMGRQLCPDHPLFSESGADTMVLNPDDEDSGLLTGDDDDDFDNHRTSAIESSVLRAHNLSEGFNTSGPDDTESTLLMDADEDIGLSGEPTSSGDASLPDESSDNILDFESGLDFSDAGSQDTGHSITDNLPDTDETAIDDFQGLDFDFDSLDDKESNEADDVPASTASLEDDQFSDSLDFESLLPDSPQQENTNTAQSDTTDDDDIESSIQGLEFSFEEVSTDNDNTVDDLNLGDFNLDSIGTDDDSSSGLIFDDETLVDSGDNVETKLELAAAYLDMDDAEGARSLLEEVAQEGDSQQQQRAQEMLERLPG